MQYSNFKTTLHQLAQKIGDIETEAEEHKYLPAPIRIPALPQLIYRPSETY